jgi:hypothetical protein
VVSAISMTMLLPGAQLCMLIVQTIDVVDCVRTDGSCSCDGLWHRGSILVYLTPSYRNHIARDVSPYVCPFEACDVPDILYSSTKDWKTHIYAHHTRLNQWLCPACSKTTDTSHGFIEHVMGNHKNIIDSDLIDDFADTCRQPELIPVLCPICGDKSDCSLDLIGEHIHEFSLLSLPWPVTDPPPDDLKPFQRSELPISMDDYFAEEEEPRVSVIRRDADSDLFDGLEPFDNGNAEVIVTPDDIFEWLSPADPSENYHRAVELRGPDTGSWFLESHIFKEYVSGANRDIILFGSPGCGKTVLSSTIITELVSNADLVVLYFYFNQGDPRKETVKGMLRSLMFQLFRSRRECRSPLIESFKRQNPPDRDLDKIWIEMLRLCELEVHLVLDAFDECTEPELSFDCIWVRKRSIRPRTIITSRSIPQIEHWTFEQGYKKFSLDDSWGSGTLDDIRATIHRRLGSGHFTQWNPRQLEMISSRIEQLANGS